MFYDEDCLLIYQQMVSPERVMAYGKLETEAELETQPSLKPPSNWPDKGHIVFTDVCYRHSTEYPLALKNISCNISPNDKASDVI